MLHNNFCKEKIAPFTLYCAYFVMKLKARMMSVNTKSVRFGGWGYSYACFKLKFTLNTHKKEREAYLHADICTGQNTNNAVIQYLAGVESFVKSSRFNGIIVHDSGTY